jgi:tetratricopeptide (TPR) repeat protein
MILNFILGLTTVFTLQQFDEAIYEAYVTGDTYLWEKTLEKGVGTFNLSQKDAIYKLSLAYYGLIGNYINAEKLNEAEKHIEYIKPIIEKMLDRNPGSSRFNALRGALYAFEINLSSYKAMFLGPKSQKYIEKAVDLDSSEPQAWVEYGNMMYYMPSIFGGDKAKGIEAYQKAIGLFENKNQLKHSWLYLNTIAVLGQWYFQMDEPKKSEACYKKVLSIEPQFKWVKELIKKQKRENN